MNLEIHKTTAPLAGLMSLLVAFAMLQPLRAQDWRRATSLEGPWKFEIGDRRAFADPAYDDSEWEKIQVPREWERQGFPGYDGYAWYRTRFATPREAQEYPLYLFLGRIDDADEVYLNGQMIGYQGGFPPDYFTAYNISRRYPVPAKLWRTNEENVLAVRVYDAELAGGIVAGEVGVFYARDQMQLRLDLSGIWRLHLEDDPAFAEYGYDEASWQKVTVPSFWDGFGHKDYDGIGWYRTRFVLPENLRNERLVLVLGKIDDLDEVYVNGKLLGRTGSWRDQSGNPYMNGDEYQKLRAYFIPAEMLRAGTENVLAVRVYDAMLHGGIWEGPVGLATRKQYLRWSEKRSVLGELFDQLFRR